MLFMQNNHATQIFVWIGRNMFPADSVAWTKRERDAFYAQAEAPKADQINASLSFQSQYE
jgi:hypothetical protein